MDVDGVVDIRRVAMKDKGSEGISPNKAGGGPWSAESRRLENRRDRATARRVIDGDGEAFQRFFKLYKQDIFNICLRICKNREDASDATQEAFATLLKRLPHIYQPKFSVHAYLVVVARNLSINQLRKRARASNEADANGALAVEAQPLELDPERSLLLSDQRRLVTKASRRLSTRQYKALKMYVLRGMSYADISEELGIKENAVAQLILRARQRLRQEVRNSAVTDISISKRCRSVLSTVTKGIDDGLSGIERERVERHVKSCDSCRIEKQAIEEVAASFRTLPINPDAAFIAAVAGRARQLVEGLEGLKQSASAWVMGLFLRASNAIVEPWARMSAALFSGASSLATLFIGVGVVGVTALGTVGVDTVIGSIHKDKPQADGVSAFSARVVKSVRRGVTNGINKRQPAEKPSYQDKSPVPETVDGKVPRSTTHVKPVMYKKKPSYIYDEERRRELYNLTMEGTSTNSKAIGRKEHLANAHRQLQQGQEHVDGAEVGSEAGSDRRDQDPAGDERLDRDEQEDSRPAPVEPATEPDTEKEGEENRAEEEQPRQR